MSARWTGKWHPLAERFPMLDEDELRERWIVIPNWDRFQHYKDRDPTWIKNYVRLLHDDDYLNLVPTSRALLHGIWLAYALSDGRLRVSNVARVCGMRASRQHWDSLIHAGFLEVSASKPLALARSRETEEETETETPKKVLSTSASAKVRRKACAWIDHNRGELVDVDLAYVIGDQFKLDDPELLADLVAYAEEKARR